MIKRSLLCNIVLTAGWMADIGNTFFRQILKDCKINLLYLHNGKVGTILQVNIPITPTRHDESQKNLHRIIYGAATDVYSSGGNHYLMLTREKRQADNRHIVAEASAGT